MKIRLATNNLHKLQEFSEMLSEYSLLGMEDLSVEETGTTYAENALLKAQAAAKLYPDDIIIADDSGLEVDVLQGAPGVRSARYAEKAEFQDSANRKKLLDALKGVEWSKRSARFVCVLCLIYPQQKPVFLRGSVEGTIALHEQGSKGFGYDSIFWLTSLGKTMGELNPKKKNQLSHRFYAVQGLRPLLPRLGAKVISI